MRVSGFMSSKSSLSWSVPIPGTEYTGTHTVLWGDRWYVPDGYDKER